MEETSVNKGGYFREEKGVAKNSVSELTDNHINISMRCS